jgi:hypothetical protein
VAYDYFRLPFNISIIYVVLTLLDGASVAAEYPESGAAIDRGTRSTNLYEVLWVFIVSYERVSSVEDLNACAFRMGAAGYRGSESASRSLM